MEDRLEFEKIGSEFGLKVELSNQMIMVRQRLRMSDSSFYGLILFLLAGIFLLSLPLYKQMNVVSVCGSLIIGILLTCLSAATLLRQNYDFLKVDSTGINGRYNLRRFNVNKSNALTLSIEFEKQSISRTSSLGSEFVQVTHFLSGEAIKMPVLTYQCYSRQESKHREFALKLNVMFIEYLSR